MADYHFGIVRRAFITNNRDIEAIRLDEVHELCGRIGVHMYFEINPLVEKVVFDVGILRNFVTRLAQDYRFP